MTEHPDVLILGGGVIGLSVAYHLAGAGARAEVVDKGDLGQESSWAGAGIIPPGNPARARTPFERLLAHSSAGFADFSEELRQRTGVDNGYARCGGIELIAGGAAAAVAAWRDEGVRAEPLTAAELRRLEPGLEPGDATAVHLPDLAQLRNPRHVKALVAACAGRGVALRPGCPVYGLERQGDRVSAALTGLGRRTAGRYLIAAGAWTDGLLGPLGWAPGVHPVRGQIALLNSGAPLLRRVVEQGKRYLVPRPDGRVLVGSTEEHVGFDRRTTAAAMRELLDFALARVPGLAAAQLERGWAGLRPGSPDGLPFLGPVPGIDNLFVAAGHFRSGIQLSLATGVAMAELLLDRPPSLPLEAFRLDRAAFRA